MKKVIALFISLVLMIGCVIAEPAAETAAEPAGEFAAEPAAETVAKPAGEYAGEPEKAVWQLETRDYPWYALQKSNLMDGEYALPLWFADGVNDLPFVDLDDWAGLITFIMTDGRTNPGYELEVKDGESENQIFMIRENGYMAIFNFDEGTVVFDDYVAFTRMAKDYYMDLSGFSNLNLGDEPFLLTMTGSRDRYGEVTALKLNEYGIPMIAQDGKHLLPLQTLSAFFLSPLQAGAYFNREAVFIVEIKNMEDPWAELDRTLDEYGLLTSEILDAYDACEGPEEEKKELLLDLISESSAEGAEAVSKFRQSMETGIYPVYASVPSAERSEELTSFGYSELCLELDCLYGLKESHSITDFNLFFLETGLSDQLLDPDAEKADKAIADLTNYWFDDGHSAFNSSSYMSEESPEEIYGYSLLGQNQQGSAAANSRSRYPNASLPYYEVGDVAYVTFDEFEIAPVDGPVWIPDYYALAEKDEIPGDTIGIIIDAHRRITRENSPIKNVVLDLSCNIGGVTPTAIYTLCWFLGEARLSLHNTFTGSQTTATYLADVNLDRVFDEKDTLADRGLNLYCLISPTSFSCGNLVPWAFKENGSVTLLGKVSGGGSCVVQSLTTAWGTSFQISGPKRIAFLKNGAYYDVDRGVEPDHIIDTYDHFFDRDALTDYIHGLY